MAQNQSASESIRMNQSIPYNWTINSNCGDVNYLCNATLQCKFTKTVLECLDDDGFVNYIQMTYCSLQSESYSTILLLILLLFLFFAIGTNADDFLCPLLVSISKSLKLSDNIAGVTFLAFGNGAPDIFSSIIGITNANPNLVIGQLYGAGIFVTTFVVGSILVSRQFEIMKRPLMRDIFFYLVTTTLVWTTFFARRILLYHSLIFISTYLIYVTVVIVSGLVYKRRQQKNNRHNLSKKYSRMPRDRLNRQTKYTVNHLPESRNGIDTDEGVILRRIKHRQYYQDPLKPRRFTVYSLHSDTQTVPTIYSISLNMPNNNNNNEINDSNEDIINSINNSNQKSIENHWIEANNNTRNLINSRRLTISDTNFFETIKRTSMASNSGSNRNKPVEQFSFCGTILRSIWNYYRKRCHQQNESTVTDDTVNINDNVKWKWDNKLTFSKIIFSVCRFDVKMFYESNILGKFNMIVKAPIYLIYTLTIPVVDNELPMNGWIRPLHLTHLILSPQICLLITQLKFMESYIMHLTVLAISMILCLVVVYTSQANKEPKYHILFAYFGFFVSISWIYAIANEVVNILEAVRVIFNLSKFMIGLTIGAWGNSIGDFMSNWSMAKNGFPRMAISACFGGPVLNMLLGIGIPYTILFIKQKTHEIEIEYNHMISVLYGTITISLLTTISILLFLTRFQSTRIHGFILFSIYICFIICAIIIELNFIEAQ